MQSNILHLKKRADLEESHTYTSKDMGVKLKKEKNKEYSNI